MTQRWILTVCANCQKMRLRNGDWHDLPPSIAQDSRFGFTHTTCPCCTRTLYPEIDLDDILENSSIR